MNKLSLIALVLILYKPTIDMMRDSMTRPNRGRHNPRKFM